MPIYHLHLYERGEVTFADEGIERADLDDARRAAIEGARGIMCAELASGQLCLSCHIEIEDEAGAIIMKVPFKDAVAITDL